jgi:ATP-dependent helicase HrpA
MDPKLQFDLNFPPDLPITSRVSEILDLIQHHQVTVIAGDTGSGKSTQLPKICLKLEQCRGLIGHTQPRRIAARSVASRIAHELKRPVGQEVGYQVRFKEALSDQTRIKIMTDGILLAEARQDPLLRKYSVLIIDEAHERSLNIDFLLGHLKQILPKRKDLKIIITSATIDVEKFSKFFYSAPTLEVSGRLFPIDVHYISPQASAQQTDDTSQPDQIALITKLIKQIERDPVGDVLVFLTGERDIKDTQKALQDANLRFTEILPLYARLSLFEQSKVFKTGKGRRVILSTNVAETSVTVPGIRYVIDTGLARVSRYSYRQQINRLPIEPISQAAADQRKGRAGRLGPGICYRLYEESDFIARPEFTEPEIQRSNLAGVILQLLALNLGQIEAFPFVDPPDNRYLTAGIRALEQIAAIEENAITSLGQKIARLPLDPKLAAMVLAAAKLGCLREVLIIVACLSIRDPREYPQEYREQARTAHRAYRHKTSDFMSVLNLWEHVQTKQDELSRNQFRKHCEKNFLSSLRIQEWQDVKEELQEAVQEMQYSINTQAAGYDQVHKALLAGLLGQVGYFKPDNKHRDSYMGAKGKRFWVGPGSCLHKKRTSWVMAFEIVETERNFAFIAAKIQPEWLEEMGKELIKVSYSDPFWEKQRGCVGAYAQGVLFGLTVYQQRKVNYGPIDPELSREVFIRQGLAEFRVNTRADFYQKNLEFMQALELLEQKTRSGDVLPDVETLYEFYDKRLPENIYTQKALEKFLKSHPDLYFTEKDFKADDAVLDRSKAFPDTLVMADGQYKLRYAFEPGTNKDGIWVEIPVIKLNTLENSAFEWLVEGLLAEKVEALLKILPKRWRRNFVPIPNFAKAICENLSYQQGNLLKQISEQLRRMTGIQIATTEWDLRLLPKHLRFHFEVIDEQGKVLCAGQDLTLLKQSTTEQATAAIDKVNTEQVSQQLITFPEKPIPEQQTLVQQGVKVLVYPTLLDKGKYLEQGVVDSLSLANQHFKVAFAKVLQWQQAKTYKYIAKNLTRFEESALLYSRFETKDALREALLLAGIYDTFLAETNLNDLSLPRSMAQYQTLYQKFHQDWVNKTTALSALVYKLLKLNQQLTEKLSQQSPQSALLRDALSAISAHQSRLIYPGFLLDTTTEFLYRCPVYLTVLLKRIDKLKEAPQKQNQLMQAWQKQLNRLLKIDKNKPGYHTFRLMVEEYHISLFSNQHKTLMKISTKKLDTYYKSLV